MNKFSKLGEARFLIHNKSTPFLSTCLIDQPTLKSNNTQDCIEN